MLLPTSVEFSTDEYCPSKEDSNSEINNTHLRKTINMSSESNFLPCHICLKLSVELFFAVRFFFHRQLMYQQML